MLDGREGVALALKLFGASVLESRRSSQKGSRLTTPSRRAGKRVMGFCALNLEAFRAQKWAEMGPRFGVEALKYGLKIGTGVPSGRAYRNRVGSTG